MLFCASSRNVPCSDGLNMMPGIGITPVLVMPVVIRLPFRASASKLAGYIAATASTALSFIAGGAIVIVRSPVSATKRTLLSGP